MSNHQRLRWRSLTAASITAVLGLAGGFIAPQAAQAAPAAALGVHENPKLSGGRTAAQIRSYYGADARSAREFVSGVQPLGTNLVTKFSHLYSPFKSVGGFDRVYISVKLNPSEVSAGKWDSQL